MASITTITTLAGTEESFATRYRETLIGKFEKMRREKLHSRSELPKLLDKEPASSHRVFVRIYSYIPSESEEPIR